MKFNRGKQDQVDSSNPELLIESWCIYLYICVCLLYLLIQSREADQHAPYCASLHFLYVYSPQSAALCDHIFRNSHV